LLWRLSNYNWMLLSLKLRQSFANNNCRWFLWKLKRKTIFDSINYFASKKFFCQSYTISKIIAKVGLTALFLKSKKRSRKQFCAVVVAVVSSINGCWCCCCYYYYCCCRSSAPIGVTMLKFCCTTNHKNTLPKYR